MFVICDIDISYMLSNQKTCSLSSNDKDSNIEATTFSLVISEKFCWPKEFDFKKQT